MIKKLNGEAPPAAWLHGCGTPKETSNNNEQVTVEQLKEKVANYRNVMTKDFGVPDDTILTMIPINIEHLRAFMDANPSELAGARMYLIKSTPDKYTDDFEVLFVPCRKKVDEKNQDNVYFEDMLDSQPNTAAHVISVKCRRPPGCKSGAALLDQP